MPKTICVYCSSSNDVAPIFFESARAFGKELASRGNKLVYGGGNVGLMGELAKSTQAGGGHVTGIIPIALKEKEVAYKDADELIITADLRDRKAKMAERADAFVALAGGFGTLEEIVEMLTLKLLGFHKKPIVFLNTNGFYDKLLEFFEHFYAEQFAKSGHRASYFVASDVAAAFHYLETYKPAVLPPKLPPL
jgi:uncharacterized protein (TIGR00730 family)